MTPVLTVAPITVVGRVSGASNAVYLVRLDDDGSLSGTADPLALYKPISGERPLWDFPHGHLAQREVAAYLISEAGGWALVPPTILRHGPLGLGSLQWWVATDPTAPTAPTQPDEPSGEPPEAVADDVLVVPVEAFEALNGGAAGRNARYHPVLEGETRDGTPVVVAHAASAELASMAVFDAVINNADRKGAHLVRDPARRLWGVDHGVSLHTDDKLRTILWGWAGELLPDVDLARLEVLRTRLDDPEDALVIALEELLTMAEIGALVRRTERLLRVRTFPEPPSHWPSVPWPPI